MSITNYIIEFKEKTRLSYMELAKQTGLSYQNIIDIKNDRIQTVSKTVLENILYLTVNKKKKGVISSDEIGIKMQNSSLILPCGVTAIWQEK